MHAENTHDMEAVQSIILDLSDALPGLKQSIRIAGGWSDDEKFKLQDGFGKHYLLRFSNKVSLRRRHAQSDAMDKAASCGIRCSRPVKSGSMYSGGSYILQTWLEGSALEGQLPQSSPKECYAFGMAAGAILRRLHKAYEDLPTEASHLNALKRIARHLGEYGKSGLKVPWESCALNAVEDGIHLLKGRPICLRHGDFHPGNMILSASEGLGIIDFDRCDYGDPFDEFYKAEMFARPLSTEFINGQLHSYFEGDPPAFFWQILKVYLADVILYSLVWAEAFGDSEVEGMMGRAIMVLEDFDDFHSLAPLWYENC